MTTVQTSLDAALAAADGMARAGVIVHAGYGEARIPNLSSKCLWGAR